MSHRVIFHLDMDAFYASVEQRDNPAFRGRPVIVGASPERRGVVCAASYEARAFGVRSAMPSRTAARLCPGGIFLPPRIEIYRAESKRIMALLAGFGATIEQVSVDEAYLEMTNQFPSFDCGVLTELGRQMKETIRTKRGLTASIGIGPNKLLAKIASDHGKPDGLFCLDEGTKVKFLRELPAATIHGVGKVTARILEEAGLKTIGDLQDYRGDLRSLVGSFGPVLKEFAFGEDRRPLELDGAIKSISAEETFPHDTSDRKILVPVLRSLGEEIAGRLGKEQMAARTVQVKVRYGDFRTLTRQTSLEDPLESAAEIFSMACAILRRERLVHRPLRLLGLGVSGLVPPGRQLRFDFCRPEGRQEETGSSRAISSASGG